jgi:hypothetical protein
MIRRSYTRPEVSSDGTALVFCSYGAFPGYTH